MRHSIYIETPFGDFQFVRTDTSLGSSCSHCALLGEGLCHLVDCQEFDNERHHFHLVRRYVEKGGQNG